MTYQYQYINKLTQFSEVSYDLVILDDEGILPEVRNSIVISSSNDNQVYLDNLAQNTISNTLAGG